VSLKARCSRLEETVWSRENEAFLQWWEQAPAADRQDFYSQALLWLREAGIDTPDLGAFWSLSEEEQEAELARIQASCGEETALMSLMETWISRHWPSSSTGDEERERGQ
jgi:hypothetical protein